MRRTSLICAALALVLAACGGAEVEPFAVMASSNGSVGTGDQRILVALVDPETDEFLASPDREATMTLRNEDGSPLGTYPMDFLWTVEGSRGLYVARVEIPEAATYQVTVDAEGLATAGPVGFMAYADSPLVEPGEKAPASSTRTSSEFPDLSEISTDPDPDPGLYELTVAEAVGNRRPSVIVFATPAFCMSSTCGPLLDQVKALRPGYPGVDFVHVEIYEDLQVESVDDLVPVPAVDEWGLPSEPWVFVVDATGVVTESFEGAASDAELAAAIDAVAPR